MKGQGGSRRPQSPVAGGEGWDRRASGLVIPQTVALEMLLGSRKLGKKAPAGPVGSVISRKMTPNGIQVVTKAGERDIHKLDVEARKERREDNKTVKKSRQIHRKRRKHGR